MRNDTANKATKRDPQGNGETRFGKVMHTLPAVALIGFLAAGVTAFAPAFSTGAHAQTISQGTMQPIDRSDVVEQLDINHNETPVARGLGANGAMFEVFAKEDGGTWTIIMTLPDGSSRMLAAGEHWTNVPILTAKGPKI